MIDLDLDELLAETESSEGSMFGLPIEPITVPIADLLKDVWVRPN
jgi:hypothetical protein